MHKRTDSLVAACHDPCEAERLRGGASQMLFIVGLFTALIAVVGIPWMRVSGRVNAANLGWMSEQWMAEHRASNAMQE